MATYYMLAMRDIRADVYSMIELWPKPELAARAFEDRCNSGDNKDIVARHPQDFELVLMGEYEDHTGTILVYDPPDRRQVALGQRNINH